MGLAARVLEEAGFSTVVLTPTPEFLSISSGQGAPASDTDMLNLREMGLIPEELPVFLNVMLAMGYTAVFLFLAYLLLHKRDL